MNDTEKLAALKRVELEIFKEFIQVCEKLNLKYYMAYGTLIGAVRHKGFIPWDDDIDVVMPRDDYEKFLEKGQGLLPKHLFIQCSKTDPEFLMPFAKIRNSNTTFMQKSDRKFRINHGVFIDIIPLDYYPDSEKEFQKIMAKKRRYDFRINSLLNYSTVKNRNTKIKIILYKILFPSVKAVLKKRNALYKSASKSDRYTVYCFSNPDLNTAPIDWFADGVKLQFEDIYTIAPKEHDKILSNVYGDYMQFPPKEQQVPHHYTGILDVNNSYKKYL